VSAVNDLAIALDAEHAATNALGAQFAAGFDRLEQRFDRLEQRVGNPGEKADAGLGEMRARFDQVDAGFAEMRGKFEQIAATIQQIVDLLTPQDDQAYRASIVDGG
jgi:hypothetical protein